MNNIFMVSLPRSGSTVLTTMLDRREDVLSMPESFFPAMMDLIDEETFRDTDLMAALFIQSCSDGSPLDFAEARECITGDRLETIQRIARKVAVKIGRDPDAIAVTIWKSTRIVGKWKWAESVGGRFVILQRPMVNVFESQFRVHFGEKNRNPLRFALFAASYLWAFRHYPNDRTYRLRYAEIPDRMDDLAAWMGSRKEAVAGRSGAVERMAGRNEWHSSIDKPFVDNDADKARNLPGHVVCLLKLGTRFFGLVPGLARQARHRADVRHYRKLLNEAKHLAAEAAHSNKGMQQTP